LLMTGGQAQMFTPGTAAEQQTEVSKRQGGDLDAQALLIVQARPEEVAAHQAMLDLMDDHSDGQTLWRR